MVFRFHSFLLVFSALVQFQFLIVALSQSTNVEAEKVENNTHCYPHPVIVPSSSSTHPSKLIIAHRGASAHLPEHTLAAYHLALELDTDYIEPDLVATKDNQLIAIHTMDINVTTDVADKFPDRATFSKYMNRTGYWSYEFTLEEIKTLRVRQRLPMARSTTFDGTYSCWSRSKYRLHPMPRKSTCANVTSFHYSRVSTGPVHPYNLYFPGFFEVPTLTEILELVQNWNAVVSPQWVNTTATGRRPGKGIYAELKDYPWLLDDTGVDLNHLLFQHIQENEELWRDVVLDNLCDAKKTYDYRVPPLIVQSFEANALRDFKKQWEATFNANSTNARTPAPPTILLVPHEKCLDDNFWYKMDDSYREFLSGIGPDKRCLMKKRWREFMERAAKLSLAVHPWTERPELDYLGDVSAAPIFGTVLDEILYLFCTVGVHGIFTESVEMAVVATRTPCPDKANEPLEVQRDHGCSGTSSHADIVNNISDNKLYVAMASFIMGAVLSFVVGLIASRRISRPRRARQIRVPTTDTMHDEDPDQDGTGIMA